MDDFDKTEKRRSKLVGIAKFLFVVCISLAGVCALAGTSSTVRTGQYAVLALISLGLAFSAVIFIWAVSIYERRKSGKTKGS